MNNREIYLASALSNAELNVKISKCIISFGANCYLPQEHIINISKDSNNELIVNINKDKIKECDYMIAVHRNIGLDTSWEIGYAKGLFKPVILLCSKYSVDYAKVSIMLYYSIDKVIIVPDWDVSLELFSEEIADALRDM